MEIAAKIDELGKPAWIVLMVLGFVAFWPIGLGILGYLIWSGRMGCHKRSHVGKWYNGSDEKMHGFGSRWRGDKTQTVSSGNYAFDEYRNETLSRLEDEQKEFVDFLERLRHAKDKAEFDQFMSERKKAPKKDKPETGPEINPEA